MNVMSIFYEQRTFEQNHQKMEQHFIIRTYGFGELAQLYNPHITKNAASYRLKCWIKNNHELFSKLQLKPHTRILTPNQVRIIIEYLDTPSSII